MPSSAAFHYLFAVCNALGGLWIFGFHLLVDPEVGKKARRSTLLAMLGPGKGKRKTKEFFVVRRRKGGTLDKDTPWSGTGTDRSSASSTGASQVQGYAETAEMSLAPRLPRSPDIVEDSDTVTGGPSGATSPADRRTSSDRPAPGLLKMPVSPLSKVVVNSAMEPSAGTVRDLALPLYVHLPPSEERGDWAADPEQRAARSATMDTLRDPADKSATLGQVTLWDPEEQHARASLPTVIGGSADGANPGAAPQKSLSEPVGADHDDANTTHADAAAATAGPPEPEPEPEPEVGGGALACHMVVQEGDAGLPELSSLSEPVQAAFNVPDNAGPAAADAVFAALQARAAAGATKVGEVAEVAKVTTVTKVTEGDSVAGVVDGDRDATDARVRVLVAFGTSPSVTLTLGKPRTDRLGPGMRGVEAPRGRPVHA